MSKVKRVFIITLMMVLCICSQTLAGSWQSDANGWWWKNDDGTYPKNEWKQIDNKWYCFNPDGYMYSNEETPDGYIVAPSGERIVPGEEYKKALEENEGLDIGFRAGWGDGLAQIIDKGAYYELTNADFFTDKYYYLDMTGKGVGDIINIDGYNYRVLYADPQNDSYGVEIVNPADHGYYNSSYSITKEGAHYILSIENDYHVPRIIYSGSVYLSKKCMIHDYIDIYERDEYVDAWPQEGKSLVHIYDFHNREWLTIPEYINFVDTFERKKQYPKGYLYGKAEVDSNGLITSIEVQYTP